MLRGHWAILGERALARALLPPGRPGTNTPPPGPKPGARAVPLQSVSRRRSPRGPELTQVTRILWQAQVATGASTRFAAK